MIPVCFAHPEDEAYAAEIAAQLNASCHEGVPHTDTSLYLNVAQGRITLERRNEHGRAEYTTLSPLNDPYFRARCEGKRGKEPLPRAFGPMLRAGARIADCTAGAGADGLLLAARGAHVDMFEREPVTDVLLRQTIRDAADDYGFAPAASRVQVIAQDAIKAAFSGDAAYDGFYIDPMFLKSSRAKSAKDMACIQAFADGRSDATGEGLLRMALHYKTQHTAVRIVVKRPAKAVPLAGIPPGHYFENRSIRYDVYA